MSRWFYAIHRWVVGGEAWAAAYTWLSENLPKIVEWIKDRWASSLAMLGSWGFGTWFASGINFINELGWGAWPFAGAILALMVAAAFWLFSHSILRRSHNLPKRNQEVEDTYAISRIRLFCQAGLDPAADAVRHLSNEIFIQISEGGQNISPQLSEHRALVDRLTAHPGTRTHALLQEQREGRQIGERELARSLRDYLEGYTHTINSLMKLSNRRELVRQNIYQEWRFRHRELTKMRSELSQDKRLHVITSILGCSGLQFVEKELDRHVVGQSGAGRTV